MTKHLSPAAQAVLAAACDALDQRGYISDQVATALRAAADQVAPSDADEPRYYLHMAFERQRIRKELLAIAAELEALDD